MFNMESNKYPGQMVSLHSSFRNKRWDNVSEDFCQATLNFLEGGYMLKETNQTFIALIPKTEKPNQISQFWPSSLCKTSYKLISKCLVKRIQPLMKYLIGDFQSAFISRRSINDNCVLAHEMLNYIKHRNKKDAQYSFILILT